MMAFLHRILGSSLDLRGYDVVNVSGGLITPSGFSILLLYPVMVLFRCCVAESSRLSLIKAQTSCPGLEGFHLDFHKFVIQYPGYKLTCGMMSLH